MIASSLFATESCQSYGCVSLWFCNERTSEQTEISVENR